MPLLSCVVSPAARSQHATRGGVPLLAMSLRRCALGLHWRCHAVRPQHATTRRLTAAAPSRRLRAVFLNAERLDYDGDHHHRITGLHHHRITGLHQQQQLSLSSHPQVASWSLTRRVPFPTNRPSRLRTSSGCERNLARRQRPAEAGGDRSPRGGPRGRH